MNLIILSDIHGLLRPAVLELLRSTDAILHAGDINSQTVVDKLSAFAPLYVVRGNNDKEWAAAIPHDLTVTLVGNVTKRIWFWNIPASRILDSAKDRTTGAFSSASKGHWPGSSVAIG